MRRITSLVAVLVLLLLSACSSGKQIQPVELSIDGIYLGMPAEEFSEFVYGDTEKITDQMTRVHLSSSELHMDEPVFMGYPIVEETLATAYFENSTLKAIQFAVLCDDIETLESELTEMYGKPQETNGNPCGKQWNGSTVESTEMSAYIYYVALGDVDGMKTVALVVSK